MLPDRVLADTQTFIWYVEDNPLLSPVAKAIISNPGCRVAISIASAWEMTIKAAQGKLDLGAPIETLLPRELARNRFDVLPIELTHLAVLGKLPLRYRDPFDRIMIAQCISERIPILSADSAFASYVEHGLALIL